MMTDEANSPDSLSAPGASRRTPIGIILEQLIKVAEIHSRFEPSEMGKDWIAHEQRELLLSDTHGLLLGMLQNKISTGQCRVQRNMQEFIALCSDLDPQSPEVRQMFAGLSLFITSASTEGLTVDGQQIYPSRAIGQARL